MAQQEKGGARTTFEWKGATAQVQAALGSAYTSCYADARSIGIRQAEDVTGDGVPEALVEYCHMGAYTSDVTVLRLENGKPVIARFRDLNKKPVPPVFAIGASVRNGEGAGLLAVKHGVYAIHWNTANDGKLAKCTVEAYVWSPGDGTFDQNSAVGKQVAETECARLRKELG